jgi:4-amino-4-deoxy-L-arabinose transferase-like glycosyltransferase
VIRIRFLVLALLVLQAALLLYCARLHSVTIDESAHIPTGLHYWRTGDFSLYSVNPPLSRLTQALPLLALGAQSAPPGGVTSYRPGHRTEGTAAREFARLNSDRYPELVFSARLAGVAWSLLGTWLIYRWAGSRFGERAGVLGASLWAFEPYVLGHGSLATPDVPAAVTALLAAFAFWKFSQRPTWFRALAAGVALGLAISTKFTLLIFVPFWFLAVVIARGSQPNRSKWMRKAAQLVLGYGAAVLVVNLAYEGLGTGTRLGEVQFVSRMFAGQTGEDDNRPQPGNRFRDTWVGRIPLPVPIDIVRGIDLQRRDFERAARPSYLAGEWKAAGWYHYYLYALAVKLPVGTLALILAGVGLSARHLGSHWRDDLFSLGPGLAILALVSSQTGFNHHSRYALPALPFLLLTAAQLGQQVSRQTWRRGLVVVGCAVATAASSLAVYPHSLSYFNEFVGGPRNGARHLLDSNIDWGQDLKLLKQWMDQHPQARPMRYEVFSFIDPRHYGLPPSEPPPPSPQPGWYAISVNAVYGMKLFRGAPGEYKYFRELEPVDWIGYSIVIYHIPS